MSQLDPAKLHVSHLGRRSPASLDSRRRYTLTHSDLTGELFLAIGADYDRKAISGVYTRLMRDEVLAEWIVEENGPALHIYCHVSGGLVFGSPGWRYDIFQYHLPQVIQAMRYGDEALFQAMPELDRAPVVVHFAAAQRRFRKLEAWGTLEQYRLPRASTEEMR